MRPEEAKGYEDDTMLRTNCACLAAETATAVLDKELAKCTRPALTIFAHLRMLPAVLNSAQAIYQ